MAAIEVQREGGWLSDGLRTYKVILDGDEVGQLDSGESCRLQVSPGSHEVFLKVDWCRSEPLVVEVAKGETATLRCAPRANLLTDLYWITLGRKRYIELTRTA